MACVADGTVLLPGTVELVLDGLEYTFVADDDRTMREVVIVSPVGHPEKFRSTFEPRDGPIAANIEIAMDEELVQSLRERFQALESHLAFRLPLARIRWDSAQFSLIFESEDERQGHQLLSFQLDSSSAARPMVEATVHDLGLSVRACDRFGSLTVHLAFFREAQNEFHALRFINAFYNYYFVLEGLYGRGHWRNWEVAREFAATPAFQRAVGRSLQFLQDARPKIYSKLLADVGPSATEPTVAEIAEYVVNQRGALHHFGNRGAPTEPTPFSHLRFQPLSQLARAVATWALTEEMMQVTRDQEEKAANTSLQPTNTRGT